MDVLEDLLTRARAQGALFARSSLAGDWGVAYGDIARLGLHVVLEGGLWVQRADDPPVEVGAGSVVLLPGGAPHRLLSAPGAAAVPLEQLLTTSRGLTVVGEGPVTELLCGAYSFSGSLCDELVAALPSVAVVPTDAEPVRGAVALLRAELETGGPGSSVVLDRLLDVLLVGCLRALWSTSPSPPVWAGVPQDRAVGAALQAVHREPARGWTVALLAREAGLSRAALARRFTAEVGVPPLTYLTRWRMGLAREALLEPGATLAKVAREVGYGTEYAFSAAFAREVGEAPGRWRTAALAARDQPAPSAGAG